jgi:hypothetical protein
MQMQAGFRINPSKGQRLIGGLGYRFGDAIQILLGMDIKNTRIGLAYDLTMNEIKPTGAFELSVSHIFMIYKTKLFFVQEFKKILYENIECDFSVVAGYVVWQCICSATYEYPISGTH